MGVRRPGEHAAVAAAWLLVQPDLTCWLSNPARVVACERTTGTNTALRKAGVEVTTIEDWSSAALTA